MNTIFLRTTDADLKKAAEIIKSGGIVVMPTETVYGLAGDALNKEAVGKIFAAKGRPADNPLIVHICDKSQLNDLCKGIPVTAMYLADKFWPGPLTIILKKKSVIPDIVTCNLDTVAIRMPSESAALKLIKYSKTPLAAPSANISGRPSPTDFEMSVENMSGRADAIIEGKKCDVGVESTVVDLTCSPAKILRPGIIPLDKLKEAMGQYEIEYEKGLYSEVQGKVRSPGMKYRHYAPRAPMTVVLGTCGNVISYIKNYKGECRALIFEDFADRFKSAGIKYRTYGKFKNSITQARNLFYALNAFDHEENDTPIIAMAPPTGTRFDAVRNRLYRAAGNNVVNAGKMKIIGLTGGSGGGKSQMCDILKERGYPVIDADDIYREMTGAECDLNREIAAAFGERVLNKDGSLNRRALAKIVLSDTEKLKILNGITHHRVIERIEAIIHKIEASDAQICFIEAIALIESGFASRCDKVVFVNAPRELRIKRIMERDKLSYENARARVLVQPSENFYLKNSDVVLMNRADPETFKKKVVNLALKMEEEEI